MIQDHIFKLPPTDSPNDDLRLLLEQEAARINNPAFIDLDPVQFPRRFTAKEDIEIVSLLCAGIAWGKRTMICKDCEKLLSILENQPLRYVLEKGYEDLPDMNIHRTFFAKNLRHYLRGLNMVYSRYGSLENFAVACGAVDSPYPSWHLVDSLNKVLAEANNGEEDSRCLPLNLKTTALKRVNMALRWLVRNDGIVDMGVWSALKPSQLFIPLDVHVGNTARALGLLTRNANDRKATEELTDRLRRWCPEDPVWFDFALFGIGARL